MGSGKRVLDIGCRDGTLTKWFRRGNNVYGIDIDELALRAFKESIGAREVLADINQSLPFKSESFDVLVLGEVMEHTFFPSEVLAECHRVLKPGGLLLGSVPNGYHLRNRLRFLVREDPESEPVHFHTFSLISLRRLLASGFIVHGILPLGGRYRRFSASLFCRYFAWRCSKKACV
jgi:2-polyprenyl-3-methyl-5-hydroxy-6-metoxy-1,4-benzoquinol methylase